MLEGNTQEMRAQSRRLLALPRVTVEQLRDWIAPTIQHMGYRLWSLEIRPKPTYLQFQLYCDRASQYVSDQLATAVEGSLAGFSIQDAVRLTQQLRRVLDVQLAQSDSDSSSIYQLEISSPGVERSLTELWHFECAVGRTLIWRSQCASYPESLPDNRAVLGSVDTTARTLSLCFHPRVSHKKGKKRKHGSPTRQSASCTASDVQSVFSVPISALLGVRLAFEPVFAAAKKEDLGDE